MARSTLARIDTDALRANAQRVRAHAPRSRVMACVKADGYGHGIVTVATAIADDVDAFAVACMEEALQLRGAGVAASVLLLEGPHSADEVTTAAQEQLTLCICDPRQLDWIAAAEARRRPPCWLKIDSGMHRLGIAPAEGASSHARLRALLGDAPIVLCTHFASADDSDSRTTRAQLARFDAATAGIAAPHSCANSAAIIAFPDSHRDWVRPGYMLYGGSPFAERAPGGLGLRPAMELSAEIISVRDIATGEGVGYGGRWRATRPSRIATIAAGYGDGYPRHATDGTPVRIGALRSPLAGRVSMDMITVDVTDNPDAVVGARAVLWGDDPGVDEIAARAGTIGYELLAGMPARVPRRVVA